MGEVTKVWWLGWYDPPKGPKGRQHPERAVTSWCTGYRCNDFVNEDEVRVARVEAPTEDAAWAALDVEFPGASKCERRFSDEREPGWWPPADRFPRRSP